jgi:hypothetical protein
MTLSITVLCRYAECSASLIIVLNVIMLRVILLNFVILKVVMLSAVLYPLLRGASLHSVAGMLCVVVPLINHFNFVMNTAEGKAWSLPF